MFRTRYHIKLSLILALAMSIKELLTLFEKYNVYIFCSSNGKEQASAIHVCQLIMLQIRDQLMAQNNASNNGRPNQSLQRQLAQIFKS